MFALHVLELLDRAVVCPSEHSDSIIDLNERKQARVENNLLLVQVTLAELWVGS